MRPEVGNYLPYFRQKYIETIYLLNRYEETYDWTPIVTLVKPKVAYHQLFRKSMWIDLQLFFEQLVFKFFLIFFFFLCLTLSLRYKVVSQDVA